MSKVDISVQGIAKPKWSKKLAGYCRKILKNMGKRNWEVSILLCDNRSMTELNGRYRGLSYPTDVLSFSQAGGPSLTSNSIAGDIVICLEQVKKNAGSYSVSFSDELKRVLVHGLLHLTGMDHENDGDSSEMFRIQDGLLDSVSGDSNSHFDP